MMRIFPQSLTTPTFAKPDRFQILLEREMFFPGETVKGTLILQCNTPVKCRGVRIHIQGKGHCYFTKQHGDEKEIYTHTQFYSNCKRTVFGNVHKTPILREAGANAIFGPPWAPDEGVLLMGIPYNTEHAIIRVMDYDWGKKDDLLGETLFQINAHLGQQAVELPLYRKGRKEQGSVVFNVSYDDSSAHKDVNGQPLRGLRVQIFKALGLRSAEMFGKNDVYVQVYPVPLGQSLSTDKALPEPVHEVILPVGQFNMPFSFQLPKDLPSSIVSLSGDDYIAYSIYAHIDIAWRSDPSTRRFFTVMQHQNPVLYTTPTQRQDDQHRVYTYFACCPLCCFGDNGRLIAKMVFNASSYAPGQTAMLHLELASEWADFNSNWKSISVHYNQIVSCWARGRTETYTRNLGMPNISYNTTSDSGGGTFSKDIPISVPVAPPTYMGGLGRDSTFMGDVARYGGFWGMQTFDPIVWRYEIAVDLLVTMPGLSCTDTLVSFRVPMMMTAVDKGTYGHICAGVDIFALARRPQQPPGIGMQMGNQQGYSGQQGGMQMQGMAMMPMTPVQPQYQQQQPYQQLQMQPQYPQQPMQVQQYQQQAQYQQQQYQQQQFQQQAQYQQVVPQAMERTVPMALPYSTPDVRTNTTVYNTAPIIVGSPQVQPHNASSFNGSGNNMELLNTPAPIPSNVTYGNANPASPVGYATVVAVINPPNQLGNQGGIAYSPSTPSSPSPYANNSTQHAYNPADYMHATESNSTAVNGPSPYANDSTQHVYNVADYVHGTEANPFYSGVEIVTSGTSKVIRDPEEDFTVMNNMDLMHCPLYFKCAPDPIPQSAPVRG